MNEKTIINVPGAIGYLQRLGWTPSRASLYRHMQEGHLSKPPWSAGDLDAYASTHCKAATDAEKDSTNVQEKSKPIETTPPSDPAAPPPKSLAAEVMLARKGKIEIESELRAFELERMRGKYIETERHTEIVCQKFQLVRQACENWIHEHVPELIAACGGDQGRRWDVVELYRLGLEKYLERLDTDKDIEVTL